VQVIKVEKIAQGTVFRLGRKKFIKGQDVEMELSKSMMFTEAGETLYASLILIIASNIPRTL
jgi:hypothetical protein